MEIAGVENPPWTFIIVSVVVLVLVQVVLYVWNMLKKSTTKLDTPVKNQAPLVNRGKEKSTQSAAIVPSKGQHKNTKKSNTNWKNKANFNHQFLASNIMGHTSKILDMECSSDGKYLVSCAEDELPPDPGDSSETSSEGSSSPQSSSPEHSPQSSHRHHRQSRQTRRRRKPRSLSFLTDSSPVPMPLLPPLKRHVDLHLTDEQLVMYLSSYLVPLKELFDYGYPYGDPGNVFIYIQAFNKSGSRQHFDVNAREFVPGNKHIPREDDSGRGSGSSSPRSADSDPDSEEDHPRKISTVRTCVRCSKQFVISSTGEYAQKERCTYHWGRLRPSYALSAGSWTCCYASGDQAGCDRANAHVWNGTVTGLNGPAPGFVRMRPRTFGVTRYNVVAIDCEMCYTTAGLELARVEVIRSDGRSVYSAYVIPEAPIVDYNTRFSGIEEINIRYATKRIKDVQRDLHNLIDAETIIVGHGLENDLRVLRIVHDRCVDTSLTFSHHKGRPYRSSLRSMASQHLNLPVQTNTHCPLEDARTSLDLILFRIRQDFFSR